MLLILKNTDQDNKQAFLMLQKYSWLTVSEEKV